MKKSVSIYFLVQLPPPVHGASMMNELLVNSAVIRNHFTIRTTDITTAKSIDAIGRFSIKKVFRATAIWFRMLYGMIFFRPDLVHFTLAPAGFAFYRDAFYIRTLKLFGKPIILHLHGKGFQAGAANKLFHRLCRNIFTNTYSIFLSNDQVSDAAAFLNKPYFIVPNGIPAIATPSEKEQHPGSPTELLFLSNYVRSKGILDLIDAAALLIEKRKDFTVKLVGKPFDLTNEDLQIYIQERNLTGIVDVCGPKYGQEKMDAFNKADIFVFPTYHETFGIVLLEAMQFGLPLISTPEGGIKDILSEGENGLFVQQQSPRDLADKITQLLDNPAKRKSMGEKGKQIFKERFSLPVFEHNMLHVFRAVLKDKLK